MKTRILPLFAFAALCLAEVAPAWADCTNPAGVEGKQIYNSTYKVMQFCNGTDWINMGASSQSDRIVSGTVSAIANATGVSVTGHVSSTGNISAAKFIGDGSLLTGISSVHSGTMCGVRGVKCAVGAVSYRSEIANISCNGTAITSTCSGSAVNTISCPSGYTGGITSYDHSYDFSVVSCFKN